MTSRAWVWHGARTWTLEDVPKPEPRSDEVLIKIQAVGFCGSEKERELEPVEHLPPQQRQMLPMVGGMGHEVAGVIEEVGSQVDTLKAGDRVAVLHIIGCKKCRFCTSGFENNCPYRRGRGTRLLGYRDYASVPASLAYPIPASMSITEAALVEPAAIGVHTVEKMANVRPGQTAVILGVGQIGSFCGQVAQMCGARVIAVGRSDMALESARDLGFDVIVDIRKQKIAEVIMEETDGIGADDIFECAGDPENYKGIEDLVAPCGRIWMNGTLFGAPEVSLNMMKLFGKEASFRTTKACIGADYERTLQLVEWGKLKMNWLGGKAISTYSMEDFPQGRQDWHDRKHMLCVVTP